MSAANEVGLAPRAIESAVSEMTDRRREYGEFSDHAALTQGLKAMLRGHRLNIGREPLGTVHQEAMDMILHKVGRIANGNPDNEDSWRDIAGYALRVVEFLETQGKEREAQRPAPTGFPRTGGVHG